MTRDEAYLKQEVVSLDPKDAAEPRGYIFAFRAANVARIIFENFSMRDVPLSSLRPE